MRERLMWTGGAHGVRAVIGTVTVGLLVITTLAACGAASSAAGSAHGGGGPPVNLPATAAAETATAEVTAVSAAYTPGPAHVIITVLPASFCGDSSCGNPPLVAHCSAGSYPSFQLHNEGGASINFGVGVADGSPGGGHGNFPNYAPGFGVLGPGQIVVVTFSGGGFAGSVLNVGFTFGSQNPQYSITCK